MLKKGAFGGVDVHVVAEVRRIIKPLSMVVRLLYVFLSRAPLR